MTTPNPQKPRSSSLKFTLLFSGLALAALTFFLVPGNEHPTAPAMAAIVALMAFWWIFEVVPIPVTSLLPLFLFPLLGVADLATTGAFYGKSTIFLFLGGFILALGLEVSGIHKRLALRIVQKIGSEPAKLVLGFMLATWFLSMWISNTATVMVMLPIALSLLQQSQAIDPASAALKRKFALALMLGIAYSADMGGMATLIGTAPNIVFKDMMGTFFPEAPEIDFLTWMKIGFPLSATFVLVGWVLMTKLIFRLGKTSLMGNSNLIQNEIEGLGPMRQDEWMAGGLFALTAFLWMTGSDLKLSEELVIPGWRSLFNLELVKDEAVAIGASILLFIIPSADRPGKAIMEWETARRLPWGILLLFGGGFAIAGGFEITHLSQMVGSLFSGMAGMPTIPLVLLVCLLLTFLTEITSNTATTNLVLPILAQAGVSIGIDPRILMVPATFSASCAFMMPVASPTQAIVFGSGHVPIREMIRAGFWFNLVGIVLVTFAFLLLGTLAWDLEWGSLPTWASQTVSQ